MSYRDWHESCDEMLHEAPKRWRSRRNLDDRFRGKYLVRQRSDGRNTGDDDADLIGKPSFEYVYPADLPAARQLFEAKKRGDMKAFQFRLRRRDGSPVSVSVQGTPMHDASGNFQGIIGTFSVRRPRRLKSRGFSADQSA
jgi:PAS domain S-box-containing protein